jgi:hypothetical protein
VVKKNMFFDIVFLGLVFGTCFELSLGYGFIRR